MHISALGRLTALVAVAASLAAAAPAAATIKFDAPAEAAGQRAEWPGYQAMDPTRVQVATSPVFQGLQSLKVETRDGDTGPNVCGSYCERAEADGPFVHKEGNEDWTAVAFYVPATYPSVPNQSNGQNNWQTSWQYFASPAVGSPPLEFGINNAATEIGFSHNFWPGTNGVVSGGQTFRNFLNIPLVKGQWHKILMHVKWSRWDNQGLIEVWHGLQGQPLVKQTVSNGTTTETGATLTTDHAVNGAQPRASNYRNIDWPGGTTQLFFDAVRVATTQAEAEAAFGTTQQYQSIENVGSATGDTTVNNTVVVSKPAATATGDVLTAAIQNDGRTTITPPSGWTQRCQADTGTAPTRVHLYTKVATASEPASYTWTLGASGRHLGGLTVREGVDTTNPVMASSCANLPDGNNMTAPSLNATLPGTLLIAGGVSTNGVTIGTPATMAERFDVRSGTTGSDRAINMATEKITPSGATGTRTFTDENPSLGATGIAAYSLLLRPAPL